MKKPETIRFEGGLQRPNRPGVWYETAIGKFNWTSFRTLRFYAKAEIDTKHSCIDEVYPDRVMRSGTIVIKQLE